MVDKLTKHLSEYGQSPRWKEVWNYGKASGNCDCDHRKSVTVLVIVRRMLFWALLKQVNFRTWRLCDEQIFTLRNIIEHSLEHCNSLIISYSQTSL